jgi:hypothetical protein
VSVAFYRVCKSVRKLFVPAILAAASIAIAGFDTAPKDQGIGGTGQIFRGDDNGISGTGYIGTITDFGSIIINGHEIEIDDSTPVKINGEAGTVADLKKGYVISARSEFVKGLETAKHIDVFHEVIGRLEEIDQSNGTGVILGQIIDFNSRLDSESLNVGHWYAISGLRAENGVVIASRVETAQVNHFLVRGLSHQIHAAMKDLKISNRKLDKGSLILMAGEIRSGKVILKTLRPYSVLSRFTSVNKIIIESYVGSDNGQSKSTFIDTLNQKLILSNKLETPAVQEHARVVLEARKSNGHFVVDQVTAAPFSDRASEHSKSLSALSLDTIVKESSSANDSETQGSEIETEGEGVSTPNDINKSETEGGSSGSESSDQSENSGGTNSSNGHGGSGGSSSEKED